MNDIFGGSDDTERTQPLAPRTPQAEPVQTPEETPTAEPIDVPEDDDPNRMRTQRGFDPQPMMRLADVDPRAIIKPPEHLQPITSIRRSMKDKSLESIGVNWKDHKDEPHSKPLFDNDVGFYELDYDPLNEKGRERGTVGVQAANIFGRQFTREELEKDSEGRKIIQMMEGVRSGEFREQGFLKGLTDFDRSNIPFIGIAMDIGTGVSDAIDMSETMRKMQRGEAVTDHEALAVRRFMLQQEIESGRTFGYGVGAVIRQAPTFMAEMALAGKVVSASTAVGSATGSAIGWGVGLVGTTAVPGDEAAYAAAGAAMGAKVGAVVGTVIAGPIVWGKRAIERLGSKVTGKAAKEAALRDIGKYATRGAAQGFTTAEGLAIRRAAGKEFFTKEARQAVMAEMRENMGADASEAAVRKAAQFETYRRAAAQAAKVTMNGKALDVGIATRIAVGGDEANLLQGEYRNVIEQMLYRAGGMTEAELKSTKGLFKDPFFYWKARAAAKRGYAKLLAADKDFMTKIADDFVDGTTKSFDDAAYRELYANLMNTSRDAMGGAGRDLVAGSMSDVTGQIIAGENSYARQVTKALIGNQIKSLQLKYGGSGFVNGMERAARYVGEHIANGVLRWDVSAFGGSIGTIARSGAVHGGKMAALKDAVGIAMIEAPVRGAMQIGAQAPLWPVYAVAAGHAPWDFTIRGQLGNQATALRTGDEELMDNARAVALGSLLVEYASENAGRGFNAAMGGVVSPVWQKTFLAKPTAKLGSYMNQKLNAMFGLDKMMQPGHNERLFRFLDRHLKTRLANMGEGSLADGIIAQDLKKIVQTRSFDGVSDTTRRALDKLGYKKANKMIRDAVVSQKWRTATQFMVADFMLRKGITPQRFNAMLERVGYDGVLAEMTEERYGGFLQGLFGLNDNPSDETWADRWRAAMEGLFPDKRQLLTEAIAFSVPSVASMSLQSIHRAIGAGSGGMQELQEDVATLRSAQSARGTVSMPGVTVEYAQRLREWKAHLDGVTEQTLGKSSDNAVKARAGVAESLSGGHAFADSLDDAGRGRIAPILDARTEEERDQFVDSLVADLVRERDYASLKKAMDSFNAEALFGQEGVMAIENEWRKQQGHSFDAADVREQALSGPSGTFAQMLKDAPLYEGDADISDIVSDITVQLGGTRSDEGVLGGAARRGGEGHESGLNMFSEDLLDQVAGSMQRIGKKMHQAEKGVGNDLSLGRRLAMHIVGVIDGLFTGNFALASASPVQYIYEDANLPRSLMGKLRKEYKSSLLVAERQLRESGERITEAKMEQVADEIMAKRARDYAAAFLASSNVLAVSKSDISEAALRLVGYRSRNADGTFGANKHASFRDDAFRAEHSQDIEAARREVLQALAETAASGILAMNDHSGMGHRTSMALNLTRAMQYGTTPEIMAAIGELPVFRHLHKVFDISGMEQEYNDVVNSGFFGRQVETDVIASIDAGRDAVLSPEQLADVAAMMGRDMTLYTEQENQEAVKQFVRQVQAVVESGLNARYEDRTGANRAVSVVKDATGFSVTYEETAGGRVVAERRDNMDEVRELLDGAGFTTVDKRIVMTTNRSITFSDALSGVLFLNQDNLENARAELLRHMGLSEDTVNEELLPHMLRRDPANGNRMGYTDAQTGRFVDVTTDAGRREAADAVKRLVEAADRADRTNDKDDLRAKAIVYGGTLDGTAIPGFSRAADRFVRSRGAVDSYEDQAASAIGQTRGYTFRVGALTAGDTLIISRDYDNGADSEALLRAAISNGLRSGFARTPEADRPVRNAILSNMAREFRAAANRVIEGLDPKADADRIDAIRAAVESVLSEEGSAVTFDGIAAMTAAMAFFTSERGLSDSGNGFLYQPELAKIADEARKAEVFPFFLSEMDQLLGGNGFFTEEAASLAGLARLRDAFAPSRKQVIDSRRSSMFDGGSAGATSRIASTNPGVSTLRWTEQGLASGFVEHAVEDTAFTSVESYLSQVAASCHNVASGFKRVFGAVPASTEDAYRRLHANELGGTTRRRASIVGEVLGSDEAAEPADTGVSGAVSRAARNAAATTRRPSGREIPLKTAISLARNFLFLVPDGASAASIRSVRQRLDAFLEGRGVSDADRARIGNAFSITAERKARYGARAEAARAEASDIEKELDQKSEGGNAEIFLENERRDALVENEDLMDCGDQLAYVFPVESTNYTAVLHRVRTELMRLRGIEDLELGDNFSTLAEALNVFNAPREGRATDRLASVEAFDNDEVTTMLLDEAIGKLADAGRLDLAFALSTLRNIPQTEGRRGKALRLVGQMSPVDGFYAEQGDDGLFAGKRQGSRAAKASITSVRSVYMSAFNNALGGRSSTDLGARLSALVNLLKGDEAHFDATKGWFGGLDVKSLTQVLGAAAKPMTDAELDPFRACWKAKPDQIPAIHDSLAEAVAKIQERLLGTADAIEKLFGANELCYALRNPAFVQNTVNAIEDAVRKGDKEAIKSRVTRLQLFQPGTVSGTQSPSLFLNHTFVWAFMHAKAVSTGTAGVRDLTAKLGTKEAAAAFANTLSGETARLATRSVFKNVMKDFKATGPFGEGADGGARAGSSSPLAQLLSDYASSMPRSTDTLQGRGSSGFRDVERTTLTPASPLPAALAVEDKILAGVGVLDDYLSRGGRFRDGSTLTAVALGAKTRYGDLAEANFVSRMVNDANMGDYVKRNDSTRFRFQLYHGEKPTAYSLQLPGEVANELFKRVMAERDADKKELFPSHIPHGINLDALAEVEDVRAVDDEATREQVYRLLYASVAAAARCDQINPKRTQVLSSQGTMIAPYRDSRLLVREDSEGVKSLVREDFSGEGVTPGHYISVVLGGGDATAWMGLWLDHGVLVESMRKMSTNPDAVSFKSHGFSLYNAMFQKGQGHDLGLGMNVIERKPDGSYRLGRSRYDRTANESLLDGQRRMRARLAHLLGYRGSRAQLLEPVDEETFSYLSPEEQKDRYDAMMAADRFFQHSSMRVTDTETNKAGPLSGDCGFLTTDGIIEMESEKLGTFYFSPETMEYSDSVETVDGVRKLKSARKIPAFDCTPEVKSWNEGKTVTLAWGLAALMKVATKDTVDVVTGEKHVRRLSSSDCGEITSTFRKPTGEVARNVPLKDAGIFLDYGSRSGDRVEVDDDGDTATFQFFTRNDISQIVANSDAESDCSTEHPYATNASRDTYLNEMRTRGDVAINEIPDTVAALCVNRAVNFSALLVNSPALVDARVAADEELYANLLRNPFDLQERGREFRKKNSVYARSARVPVYSNHGVLLPSGGKVTKADIFAHTCEIEWAPGTTQYTKDMFRHARVYTPEEAAAFGQARSYSSGAVNIRDDGSFRYGMALDPKKWDSFINRFGKVFGIQAHDDLLFQLDVGAEDVMGTDSQTCDELAKVFSYFRSTSTRGVNVLVDTEVAGRRAGEVQNVQLATDVFSQFLGCFTDYTGLHLNDGAHRDVSRMSFDDLFREDGSFDLAAIDRRTAKVDGGLTAERLFIGGSFFSGSRRPSGNIEAAVGLCRATMPVTFSNNGTPGASALYQLDPIVCYNQGSDTDGDSASIIIHKGHYDDTAIAAIRGLADLAKSIFNENEAAMRGEFDEYRSRARRFYDEAKRRHPEFFREDGSASEAFHDAIANLVFRTEVENYRRSKAVHQGWAENPASNAPAYDMSLIADSSKDPVPDIGAVGRRPVSPDLLNDTRKVGDAIAEKYAKRGVKSGMDFKKAFRAYVNSVNPEVNSDLLDPVSAASLSDAAADASDGRGVMVALQASIEHLGALAMNDREMQKVAPALLVRRAKGYDPLADFIGHLDGVSNALFDVVKDMFAPRAGWRKEMLTYMVGRFVVHANDAYVKDKSVQFDDAWFFREAVSFIDDALNLNTFAGRLMYATGDATGTSAELQSRYDASDGETLLARVLASANVRPERFDPTKRTFLSHIGIMMRTAIDSGGLDDIAKRLKPKVRGMLTEIIANDRNAIMGAQYTLLAADILFSTEEELAKRGNPVEKAYEAYRAYDVMNTIRVLENAASPDSSFSGDPSRVGTYQRASELDRISDTSQPYSLRNAAKGLINGVTGANMRRMLDESVDARTEAREMTTDIEDFDVAVSVHSYFADALNAFAESRGIPTESLRKADMDVFEKALAIAKRSNAKYAVNAGTVANNRDMLHHVIGCVAFMENGRHEEALAAVRASLAKGGTEGFRRDVAGTFADLVESALNSTGPSTALRTFYEYLNVDRASGDITFLAKPDSEDAIDVANGLRELHGLQGSVKIGSVDVPLSQLPRVFALHQAVSGSFSGTSDPRVRPNPAAFFGTDALNSIERWGTGITKHPASRLLCLIRNEAKGSSAYNIAAALPVIEELVKAPGYAAVCSARPALSSTALQAIDIAEDSVLRTDNGFRAEGVRFQLDPKDAISYHVGDRKGRARKLANRRAFDTLEEAYNDLIDQVLAAHFGTDGLITGGEVIRTAVDGVKPQGIIRYTGLDELETMKKILVSSMRGDTGEALKKAVLALDDRSLDFSTAVKRTPGVTRTNAPALLAMKEYLLSRQATQAGGETRRASIQGAPEIGEGSYAIAQRMRRGDFSIAGKNRGPQAAVTHALESAFGKWGKNGGVRVTRVKRDGKPVNLLKVERKLKTKEGVKTVVTYISYGDAVMMDLTDTNQVDSLVNYLHQRGWKGTAKDFMSLSVEERNGLAVAFGARVRGDSLTGIDTNGVLALSGLIRLSNTATFNTLFHEYFHQMYDLMDRTGTLSQDEKDALAGEYRMADGRFDEEAAADAFARYVTDMNESGSTRMFSDGKEAVESAFSNIHKTCKAFAEALSAEDATGAPAFMKALITGDLTDRLTKRLDDAANLQLKEIEDALLGEETWFESVKATYLSGDQVALAAEVRAAVERNAPIDDVKAAIRALIDGKAPQFEAHLNEPSVMEQGELDFSEKPVEARKPAHPETPVGRMQEFMKAALDRFGVDSAPLGLDGEQELKRIRDLSQWGELPASDVMLLASTARRVIADTADFLGYRLFNVDADGKSTLTAEGREFLSDDAITEMTVRLCRHMNAKVAAENRENPYGKRAVNASADKVYGAMLAEVAKERWVPYTKGRIDEAADGMLDAAAKLRQKADAVDGTDHERAIAMRNDATKLAVMSRQIRHAFTQMMNGGRLHEVQGFPDTYQDNFTYGNLLGGVHHELLQDGRKRYLGGNFSSDAMAMQEFQAAMDKAAHTLFTVACARSYIRKIGQDFPPIGAEPEVRRDDPAPDPGYLIDEADTSAQMILQSPGAWMAADMMRDFMGVNIRDVMTDHDIKAKTESANLLASTMDFVFGADCHAGEKVREIGFGTSDVGFDESGIDVHDERMRHSFMKFAAVRGVDPLGVIVRDAKRTGRELSLEDCDTIDFIGQVVKAMSCGDRCVITGIDLPWPNKATLDVIRDNWKNPAALLNGPLSRKSVTTRVKRYAGETATSHTPFAEGAMPNNIDHMFYRIYEALPKDFQQPVLETLAQAIIDTAEDNGANAGTTAYSDARERLVRRLSGLGLCETSKDGRCVLTIPVEMAKDVWHGSEAYAKLMEAGRTAGMLNLEYWAARFAAEANALHEVAAKSQFMQSATGRKLTSAASCGMWFHHGSGAHRLNVARLENAKEVFGEKVSSDEKLAVYHAELMEILQRHSQAEGGSGASAGDEKAFSVIRDASGNLRVSGGVTHRQVQYLIRLLSRYGVLVRDGRGNLTALQKNFNPVDFVLAVQRGEFSFGGGSGLPVHLDADSTVFDFDKAIYTLVTQAVADEIAGIGSGISEFGTKQGLIDAHELASRLERDLGAQNKGRVAAVSPVEMFRMSSRLGSSMSAAQNLRAMCEEIVTAERYKGAMTQMLQTVGPDGAMNYIVKPTDAADRFLPDEYWGALARFTIARNQGVPDVASYDMAKTGVENMKAVYDSLDTETSAKYLAGTDVRDGRPNAIPVKYAHFENLRGYSADTLFEDVLVRRPGPTDSPSVLDRAVGGEAMGYMKQLLGMVAVPPPSWFAANIVDRLMSYSKVMSVGMSAFFAFATRFESPVAASGFWATVMGYHKKTADAARKIGAATGKAGQTGAFNSDAVFLADILHAMTSNDPYIREMRELCDLIGMPLTDSIQNPITDKQGAIDKDIDWLCRIAEKQNKILGISGIQFSKRIRAGLRAALHNPSEYAFSNVLNGVKMAVVSQTLRRLREECREQARPFDPVRELRKYSPYINAEIGGIDPGRYAFLTPQMQRVLRDSMFSYQWTLGAWVAGTGEVVSDLLGGGHNTTPELRRLAFIRWLRMLGIIKVGVPVFMQMAIKSLATCIAAGMGDPDGDDDDPYGIEAMPWLCFNNEEKIGALSFDITPLLRLCGSSETMRDIKLKRGAWPYISAVAGGLVGYGFTKGPVGAAIGAAIGRTAGDLVPAYVGRGKNTTGNRRYYMHFGKQNDEFWRWFTEPWQQATNKLSIPTQKVVEALFGSTNGSNFAKSFAKKGLADRIFTTNLDPNENAVTNFMTSFLPFSSASIAAHPDAGVIGLLGPVQLGASKTYIQKRLVDRLVEFAEDDHHRNPWATKSNRASLELLCKDILDDAALNGVDPKDILTSAIGQAASREYTKLFNALPKDIEDNVFDVKAMTAALRALARLNRKNQAILQALGKRYKATGIDWESQPNAKMGELVRKLVEEQAEDPYGWSSPEYDELVSRFADGDRRDVSSVDVQQDRKGGEAFSNFLATDDVPETLFGIPVVSQDYTEEDLEFFKRNPKAAGFYDLGDDNDEQEPPPDDGGGGGGGGGGPSADLKGGISGAVLGAEDPDKGKVKTSIPLKALRQDNKGGEADWDFLAGDGGSATLGEGVFNKWGGNLRNDGRKAYLFRDDNGKVTGYGTTASTVVERNGRYYVVPTIVDGNEPMSLEDAGKRFDETGEHWASAKTAEEADRIGRAVHEHGEARYRKLWNEYIQDHWGDMADSITNDTELADIHAAREYIRNSAGPLTRTAYDFMVKGPGVEGFDAEARLDVNGKYVLGHGAQSWGDRKTKVKEGQKTTWLDAAKQFREDVLFRDNMLRDMIPGYDRMDRNHKAALIDIAFGKEGVLSPGVSKKLHEKLNAAKTRADLHEAVESEYHTYGTKDKGLRNRRIKVAKHLFNKDLSYAQDASGKWIGTYK